MSKENFYEEKLEEIKKLIPTNIIEAKNLLDEELKMPYIPMKYENAFYELEHEIAEKLHVDENPKFISEEQAEQALKSNDGMQIAYAIKYYQKSNIRQHIDVIKSFLEETNEHQAAKALIFEMLIEQNIDIELKINGIKLNPKEVKSIVDPSKLVEVNKLFEKEFNKEPQLIDIAMRQFMEQILLKFPQSMNQDFLHLANLLVNIVKKMFYENIELTKEEDKLFKEIVQTKN